MKKTGKALSLVLSLALVASSLTATFASAATSSETGTVSYHTSTFYLCNGGSGNSLKLDITGDVNSTNVSSFALADHSLVTDYSLKDVAITSGSSLATVKVTKTTDGNNNVDSAVLTLSSATATGTITVASRYQGTVYRGTNTDTTTVYATATTTFNVLKDGQTYILADTSVPDLGGKPDALGSLAKNLGDTVSGAVYTVTHNGDTDAQASWTKCATDATTTDAAANNSYYLQLSNNNYVNVTTGATTFTLTATKPTSVQAAYSNPSTFGLTATKYASNAASTKSTDKVSVNGKIANQVKLNSANTVISSYAGKTYAYSASITSTNVTSAVAAGAQIVTNCDIVLGANTQIVSGTVGAVSGAFTFTVDNGTVSSIAADSDSTHVTTLTVNKGSVGNVGNSDHSITTVNVYGGTVGNIYAGTVTVDSNNDQSIKVGNITGATNATLTSEDGYPVKAGDIKTVESGNVTLSGNQLTVGTIDGDYRDATVDFKGFTGTVVAPKNSYTKGINSLAKGLTLMSEEKTTGDTIATISSDAEVRGVNAVSGTINFSGKLTVRDQSINGGGYVGVNPGKLYTDSAITGVNLKFLSDFKVGDTVFTAATGVVDSNSFTPVGYTLSSTTGTTVDTFKIATVTFAGLTISGPATITKGTSATYTVSAYPNGTSLPTGDTIAWYYTGNDDNFTFATTTDGKLTVTAKTYDTTFSSANLATITAKVLDASGAVDDNYAAATQNVSIVLTATYTSDTAAANLKVGQTYQFKITSSDGSVPPFAVASNGATVAPYTKSGNAYFFKVTAAKAGTYGVYCGGKVATLTITSDVTIDTAKVTIAAGKTYQFKVTASATPVFQVAGVGTIKASSSNGNNYFYKVTATSAKGGHGVYVNGQCVAVATFA